MMEAPGSDPRIGIKKAAQEGGFQKKGKTPEVEG